jgi:hypothetical protein
MQVTTVSAMLAQLHQREAITMQIASASRTLAMLRSRDAVKDSLRRSGVKVSHLAARRFLLHCCPSHSRQFGLIP